MTKLQKIRQAVADYIHSEGCTCCQHVENHKRDANRLGELLAVPKYSDGSGYDFNSFRTTKGKSEQP